MIRTVGTRTVDGFIPHHFNDAMGIWMPVKVVFDRRSPGGLPRVKTVKNKLVFALPGGGEWISPHSIRSQEGR